jgi:hypothetical protein
MWESRSVFCGGVSKQLVEIIKKKSPKRPLWNFHSCGIFHSPKLCSAAILQSSTFRFLAASLLQYNVGR